MTEEERRYIEKCLANAEASDRFFSGPHKPERERLECAWFLRALRVPFAVEELIAVPNDGPPDRIDVQFREARFQVRELLDAGCRRHDEAKDRVQQLRSAKTIDDTLLGYPSEYVPMSYDEVYSSLTEALARKASDYGEPVCARLDALVCIQRRWRYLDSDSPLPGYEPLMQQGWRSVSLVMRSSSHVVYAKGSAPAFLREYAGQTKQWDGTGPFYDL